MGKRVITNVSKGEKGQRAGTHPTPVVAQQNARLYAGYTGTTLRQADPPSVAYLNNLARTFDMPWTIRQRMQAPASNTEVFASDPRSIVGNINQWKKKEAYFRNMHLRDLGGARVNPERTPNGSSTFGHPYQPAGLTYRFLPRPDDVKVDTNSQQIPLYRGY